MRDKFLKVRKGSKIKGGNSCISSITGEKEKVEKIKRSIEMKI